MPRTHTDMLGKPAYSSALLWGFFLFVWVFLRQAMVAITVKIMTYKEVFQGS